MWIRWRKSRYTLYPWHYMTNNIVYANDLIDMECLESMAKRLEKEIEKRQERERENRNATRD